MLPMPDNYHDPLDDVDLDSGAKHLYSLVLDEHDENRLSWDDLSDQDKNEWRVLFSFAEHLYNDQDDRRTPLPVEGTPKPRKPGPRATSRHTSQ